MTPKETTKAACEALLADIQGFEVENLHEHFLWMGWCEPMDIPEEYDTLFSKDKINECICAAIYDRQAYKLDDPNDFLFFSSSLVTPMHVRAAAMQVGLNFETFTRDSLARFNKDVDNAHEAMFIAFGAGAEAPRFWQAAAYLLGDNEDVPEQARESLKDDIDAVAKSLDLELPEGDDRYNIELIIDAATDLANRKL